MEWQEVSILVAVLLTTGGGAVALLVHRVEKLDDRMRTAEQRLAVLEPVHDMVRQAGCEKLSLRPADGGR